MEKYKIGKTPFDVTLLTTRKQLKRLNVSDENFALEHLGHQVGLMTNVYKENEKKISEIKASRDFSEEGRNRRLAEAKDQAKSALEQIDKNYKPRERILEIKSKLATAHTKKEETPLSFLKETKMEKNLQKFNQYERDKIILKAAEEGGLDNELIVNTAMNAHPLDPLVTPETISKAKNLIEKRMFPQLIRERNDLEALEYIFSGMIRGMLEVIGD